MGDEHHRGSARTFAGRAAAALVAVSGLVGAQQYKRVHADALFDVARGRVDAALEALAAFDAKRPGDPETGFARAAARVAQGDLEGARREARAALAAGLPWERFVAGPPEWFGDALAPLADEQELGALLHGPRVGHVTESSARIWIRSASDEPPEVHVEGVESASSVDALGDRAYVIEVGGLAPDTEYEYSVGGRSGRLRTAPRNGEGTKLRLAFGGGAGYVPKHERMWTTIAGVQPQALLLLGDNVYIDRPKHPAMQRYGYYRRQSREEWRALVANVATYSIWDDHDFGTNDRHGGPAIDEPAWKRPVWELFRENWANPGYGGGAESPGCWYAFSFGDVDFVMLDGRYYRENPRSERPSMLGPAQKAWLSDTLRASSATFKVLCSPVPWDYRTKGDSKDTWNGYRAEREELFAFLHEHRIEGVVLMSADRHRSDAWLVEREEGYDLYELNSSRLTNQHTHPTMDAALFSYNAKPSFGLVEIDTTVEDPTLAYTVVNIDGEAVESLTVRRSALGYR